MKIADYRERLLEIITRSRDRLYWRLRICINKIKITDYIDYERLHWDYRPSVLDYSRVSDPSATG